MPSFAADLLSLTKPRVTALVVATAAAGLALAPQAVPAATTALVLTGVALMVGAANTLNCWMERDSDRLMTRTCARPLPARRLAPGTALATGAALMLGSLALLGQTTNPTTTLLTLLALVIYVGAYTPLKRRSPAALLVGAVPGALPPLIGWTAATGRVSAGGLALFGLLFVWQLPHFLAIALRHQEEYARAGLRVLPVVHGARRARRSAALWALALLPASLAPALVVPVGTGYVVTAAGLGAAFAALALAGLRREVGPRWAGRLFVASIAHLTLLSLAVFLASR